MSLYSVALSLFFVLNSIGNIPLFVGMLGRYDVKRQRKIIMRELMIALGILLAFNYFGQSIFRLLGITQPIIGISGGTLLFLISLSMIFPKADEPEMPRHEPLIVPLAIPIVSGPGSIATVMVYAEQLHNPWIMTIAIMIAWIPSVLILVAASNIKLVLGQKGLIACERLGGMLVSLIAFQMFSSGVLTLMKTHLFSQ